MSTLLAFGASRSSPFRKMYPIQWSILASTLKIVEVSKILSHLLELTNVVLLERDEYYAVAITYEVSKKYYSSPLSSCEYFEDIGSE